MKTTQRFGPLLLFLAVGVLVSCTKQPPPVSANAPVAKHEHHPPHGGTPVVLGDEIYHVEFVLNAANGQLSAYILDGEMENFIRSAMRSFDLSASVNGETKTLTFRAVANSATGESDGDTSLFQTQADWLKTTKVFDGVIMSLTIRGTTFHGVAFNFPAGNDKD